MSLDDSNANSRLLDDEHRVHYWSLIKSILRIHQEQFRLAMNNIETKENNDRHVRFAKMAELYRFDDYNDIDRPNTWYSVSFAKMLHKWLKPD